jgi:4-hydroxybenzoate polyprenyltransferase
MPTTADSDSGGDATGTGDGHGRGSTPGGCASTGAGADTGATAETNGSGAGTATATGTATPTATATATATESRATRRDRLAYLLTLSRPRFWFYLAGPVVVGVAFAAESVTELFAPVGIVLFAYFLLPGNVLLYGVNDVYDAEIDARNPKKDDAEGREARFSGERWVVATVVACGLAGLGLFALVPPAAWPWLGAFFALAVEYSAPPLRFKTTPLLDSVSNGLYVLPGVVAYVALSGTQPPAAAVVAAWLWAMGMHTFSAIPDIEPDRAAGIRTTATVLGEERTYAYCAAAWIAAAATWATVDPRIATVMLAYPIVVFTIYWSDVDVSEAYWWYPAINTVVGMLLTMGALTRIVPPARLLEVVPGG